ncbi:MAG: 2-oxoglutarate ferredoxin oxidoreductase subunit alpha, partial [Sandaracinaceae bacterium]|nr:2-oxoglutarate ferredoxin oxidoreductase subunit alpha [Sandaracinaceae bacterium]
GQKVSHYHLRNIWPLPNKLGDLLKRFDKVVVAELNNGQLARLLRSEYLVDCKSVAKIAGQPFRISELVTAIQQNLEGGQ